MEEMTRNTRHESNIVQRIVSIIFGLIQVALAFRLVFKLLGANPENAFVQGIYNVTEVFVKIFEGIFSRVTFGGGETTAVFEPSTLIAMAVIALINWVVLKLITPLIGNRVERTNYTDHDDLHR
ncbi:MAG: hypothetical protein H6Q66_2910 [Firmicutes bacterium]|nr:hypothetical protein [Bacillota bacterium]